MPAPQTKEWARDVPLEIKAVDAQAHTFRGIAAAWSLDLGNDVIHKGAFERTLDHWRNAKRRPVYLLNGHKSDDVRDVIGKMIDAVETDQGLETEWQFVPDDPTAEAAFKRVQGGFVTGMSIGYTPINPEVEVVNGKRVRHLKEVKLHEVSLVVFPMNEDARVDTASVKTLAQWQDMNDEERKAYVAALPDEDKAALRALLEPAAPALAPEDVVAKARHAFARLNLQQLATRARGSAPVGQTIAPMSDRTDEHFRKAG